MASTTLEQPRSKSHISSKGNGLVETITSSPQVHSKRGSGMRSQMKDGGFLLPKISITSHWQLIHDPIFPILNVYLRNVFAMYKESPQNPYQ